MINTSDVFFVKRNICIGKERGLIIPSLGVMVIFGVVKDITSGGV